MSDMGSDARASEQDTERRKQMIAESKMLTELDAIRRELRALDRQVSCVYIKLDRLLDTLTE